MSKNGAVHLVGSVPLESVDDVFRTCAGVLGSLVSSYPDGEVGQRKYWTFYLPTRTYSVHPDLEAVNAPPDGQVRQPTPGREPEGMERIVVDLQAAAGRERT